MGAIISRGNRPSDYNVIGGLLGLGEYILLEILSELKLVPDSIQFIGTCNKTLQLKNHPRFYQIIETLMNFRELQATTTYMLRMQGLTISRLSSWEVTAKATLLKPSRNKE
ncbi:MAG: hypothetical protein EZS28_033036, partial [Streblomastix strix]